MRKPGAAWRLWNIVFTAVFLKTARLGALLNVWSRLFCFAGTLHEQKYFLTSQCLPVRCVPSTIFSICTYCSHLYLVLARSSNLQSRVGSKKIFFLAVQIHNLVEICGPSSWRMRTEIVKFEKSPHPNQSLYFSETRQSKNWKFKFVFYFIFYVRT